jgi:hypothetical protein
MLARMCCFSSSVSHVSRTRIFARGLSDGRQTLAYAMTLGAPSDVAMVLPIPVPDDVSDDAVRFISLEGYEGFFDDLEKAFPEPPMQSFGYGEGPDLFLSLEVHSVGAYVASFVPRAQDFVRLDPRFRLPGAVLDGLPVGYGFVVFALAEVHAAPEARQPMAFTFPRRDARSLFFPTLHVHDGTVPAFAGFDHTLYAQLDEDVSPHTVALGTTHRFTWRESDGMLARHLDAVRAKGLVDPSRRAFSLALRGPLPNHDVIVHA